MHSKIQGDRFFETGWAFYPRVSVYLIKFYANDFKKRSEVAFNGKKKYFKLFENHIVSKYMIEKILNQKITNKLSWMD